MLSREIIKAILTELDTAKEPEITSVSGGSINSAHRVKVEGHSVFVKTNQADTYPGMFDAEARGLELISKNSTFEIPSILKTGIESKTAYLVMEWIANGSPDPDFWENFAKKLADLHRHSSDRFGLEHHNYIGSIPQQNNARHSWSDFYIEMRLEPQLRMARDNGHIGSSMMRDFDKLFVRMENLFPKEPPALIHGDLWSGNFMCTDNGEATIFDPAVYFGHREMDLAMSKLFGGFDRIFYDHYHENHPLENGWQDRIPLGQLYPLLVHVNLFGGGYLSQVKSCLRSFV